jgi:hypothetical protein
MHASFLAHLLLLDLITLIIFGKEYKYEAPHYTVFSIQVVPWDYRIGVDFSVKQGSM